MLHDQRASGRSRHSRSTSADFPTPASPLSRTSRPSPPAACAAYSLSSARDASRSSSGGPVSITCLPLTRIPAHPRYVKGLLCQQTDDEAERFKTPALVVIVNAMTEPDPGEP